MRKLLVKDSILHNDDGEGLTVAIAIEMKFGVWNQMRRRLVELAHPAVARLGVEGHRVAPI